MENIIINKNEHIPLLEYDLKMFELRVVFAKDFS